MLNTLTGWIDKVVSIIVNFIVRPIIINGLGISMFGVWEMLNRMTDLMASADFRAATTVKWFLSINREKEPQEVLNRSVSSGFFASMCTLPLYVLVGCVLVYFSPYITKVDISLFMVVRFSASILLLAFIITQIFFIYEQILQGMNIAYKRIGVRAVITIVGGILTYLVLKKGYGLGGLVCVNLLMVIITGFTFWFVVKENLNWVKIHKVSWKEILVFIKISIDFFIDKLLSILHRSTDVLFLGYLLSSSVVASYTISSYVMVSIIGFISMIISSIITGITPLVKENNVSKLLFYRSYIYLLLIVICAIVATLVLVFNGSFINLWTQKELFLGQFNNLLIVVGLFLRAIIDIDKSFLCMYLKVKTYNINSFVSLIVMAVSVSVFIKLIGVTGLLVGLILSEMCLLSLNIISLKAIMQTKLNTLMNVPLRLILVVIVFVITSYVVGKNFIVDNWVQFFVYLILGFCVIASSIYWGGLNKTMRMLILKRIKTKKEGYEK